MTNLNNVAILCVDDDPLVLDSLWLQLDRSLGKQFVVECAESAEEGFEVIENLANQGIRLVLIVSDFLMPQMQGHEFVNLVRAAHPSVKAIVLSGQADETILDKMLQEGSIAQYIRKPWDEKELLSAILSLT